MLALAATLAVTGEADAAPKSCNLKPAACKLQEHRAEQRAAAQKTSAATTAAPTPGGDNLRCASKSAACDLQKKAEARQPTAAAAPAGEPVVRPQKCTLKTAACDMQARRAQARASN